MIGWFSCADEKEALATRLPLFPAHIANVQILLPRSVIRHINNIPVNTSLVTGAHFPWARNHLNVRQRVILAGELVDHNFKGLRGFLLNHCLRNQTTLQLLLAVATIDTLPGEFTRTFSIPRLQIQVKFTGRTELHSTIYLN